MVYDESSTCLMTFSDPGDTCLGRILARCNPNNNCFGALHPHFAVDNPSQYEHLNEVMNQLCSSILTRLKDITSNPCIILLLFLASVVYHENLTKECVSRNTNHSFLKIPTIHDSNLVSELKKKI